MSGELSRGSSGEPEAGVTGRPWRMRGPRCRRHRRPAVPVAATASALLLLTTAACGDLGSRYPDGPGYNAANGKLTNPSAKKGGTLKFLGTQDADSWDPTRGYYGFAWDFMRYYSRQLVSFKAAPGKEGNKLVPDLATHKAEISDGGRTYTYHLKKGVTWQDGRPVTAQDVKYGIERQWAQDVLSGGPVYVRDVLDPHHEYKGPYKDPSKDKLGLKAIETPDARTVVFHLPERNGDFEQMLAMPAASPVRKDRDSKSKYGLKPFSNGPYEFRSYTPNKNLTLVRNPHWKKSSDDIRKALPDKVTLTLLTNPDEMDKRLIHGDYDVDINATGLEAAGRLKALKQHKGNVDNPDTGYLRYAVFPQTVKPFDNIHCRRAILYGADHKSLQNARGGPLAGGDIGTNMLPRQVGGSDPHFDPYGMAKHGGAPDIRRAKAELRKCGKPHGFKTTIAVRNNKQVEVDSAQALQASLKRIGVQTEVDEYDGAQTTGIVGSPREVKKKGYGIIIQGWSSDFPTGQGFGRPLWDGRYILDNGNNNYAMIDDPEINALFTKAVGQLDEKKAAKTYAKVNEKVMEGAYYLPFTFEKNLIWRSSRLTNAYTTENFGRYDYASLGVR